jgi:WD40 repeat protein
VRLYDAADWKAAPRQLPGWKDVRFDAAGNLISDGKVRLGNPDALSHNDVPTSPSGKIGIEYRQQEGKAVVVLTDLTSSKQTVLNTELVGTVNRVAFSPDEQYVAFEMTSHEKDANGWDEARPTAQLWNAATRTRVATLDIPIFDLPVDTFTFHAQGKLLVFSGSSYDGDGMSYLVKIWDGRTGQEIPGTANAFVPVVFSPDDRWMAFPLWQDGIAFWSDHEIGKLGNFPMTPLFSPNSKLLVGYDTEQIRIWKTESVETLKEPEYVLTGGTIQNKVFFSPDSHWLAVDELDNLLRLWNVESGTVETVISNITAPFQFSPDSQWILAKQADSGKSALWDARTGERLLKFADNFAINPTWTIAAQWTGNSAIQVIKLPTGEQVSALWVIDNPIGEVVQFDAGTGRVLFEGKAWDTLSGQSLFTTQIPTPLPDYPLSADWKRLLMVGNPFDSGSAGGMGVARRCSNRHLHP